MWWMKTLGWFYDNGNELLLIAPFVVMFLVAYAYEESLESKEYKVVATEVIQRLGMTSATTETLSVPMIAQRLRELNIDVR